MREARLVRRLDGWNDETARDFAAACAEHVLPLFERQRPSDDRPRRVIETARLFALNRVSADELSAAWSAARDVMTAELLVVSGDALAAVRAAAMSAAVGPGWAATTVAGDAAHAARDAVAWAATRAVAQGQWGVTAPEDRTKLRDSVTDAWASAEAKERAWQTERLLTYLALNRVSYTKLPLVAERITASSVRAAASRDDWRLPPIVLGGKR